jgi:Ribonuclease HI
VFEVNIYISTTITGPGRRMGQYMAVAVYKGKKEYTREIYGEKKETTYHESVLLAITSAIELLTTPCIVNVRTDCLYFACNLEERLEAWVKSNFKNGKGEDIAHWKLWEKLFDQEGKHKITIGHTTKTEYTAWMNAEMKRRGENDV